MEERGGSLSSSSSLFGRALAVAMTCGPAYEDCLTGAHVSVVERRTGGSADSRVGFVVSINVVTWTRESLTDAWAQTLSVYGLDSCYKSQLIMLNPDHDIFTIFSPWLIYFVMDTFCFFLLEYWEV